MRVVEGADAESRLRGMTSPSVFNATGHTLSRAMPVALGVNRPRSSCGTQAARSPLSPEESSYATSHGWPVKAEAGELVLECGHVVDLLATPMGLAGEVNHLLKLHNLTAPVMEVRGRKGTTP